ncbi:unnamed protein product [Blumeria hordei]|uniref:Utp8 beta-propeller domain-containing protein n=1 Tax=Blumeria hordei TaxID=2867405 RepID=A0A383URV8_BLUHO|nr:unnamed protein product [Blumeria hordei]
MTSNVGIQTPHVIASLPNLRNNRQPNYVVCEVYGSTIDQKKRKRPELVVGIDGEGVELYDVSTSRLITSYALPPQSSLTCAPNSIRIRISETKVERKTYVSSIGKTPQITLFSDSYISSGDSQSKTVSQQITGSASRVLFIRTIGPTESVKHPEELPEVIVVKEDGEIQGYDSETLQEKWTSPASALFRDFHSCPEDLLVEYACITRAYSARKGILKGRQDVFTIFPQEVTEMGFNPDLLILVTISEKQASRNLLIVSLPRKDTPTTVMANHRPVNSLLSLTMPYNPGHNHLKTSANFSVHASSGTIHSLENGVLTIYDLTNALPKELYKLKCPGSQSFIRLASMSTIVSTGTAIEIYNLKFYSKLATTSLGLPENESLKRKRDSDLNSKHSCKLITYFPKLSIAVALIDNNLVGVQVEARQDRRGKTQLNGFLVDSLGCFNRDQSRPGLKGNHKKIKNKFQTLKSCEAVTSNPKRYSKFFEPIEKLFDAGTCTEEVFDCFMTQKLPRSQIEACDTPEIDKSANLSHPLSLPAQWPCGAEKKRAMYALSKIFTCLEGEDAKSQLSISFYPPKTFLWLIKNGYMTTSNIDSALRVRDSKKRTIPAGQLIRTIAGLDSKMKLLYDLVSNTHLEATELICAVRELIDCLGIEMESGSVNQKYVNHEKITAGSESRVERSGDKVKFLEEIDVKQNGFSENSLGNDFGTREKTLALALSKLYTYPDEIIVNGIRTNYGLQTTVSLIYLLRIELARGGWTAKYLETETINNPSRSPCLPDSTIVLIVTLLNCCIDAVGTAGWLSGEVPLADGTSYKAEDFITSLQIETSALLECIEEATYLQNILTEMVRFGCTRQKEIAASKAQGSSKPISLTSDKNSKSLPFGLRTEKPISLTRVVTGGEISRRTMRDVGDRKSRRVGKYCRERIIV